MKKIMMTFGLPACGNLARVFGLPALAERKRYYKTGEGSFI